MAYFALAGACAVNILSSLKPGNEVAVPEFSNGLTTKPGEGFAIFPNPARQMAMVDLKSYAGKTSELMIFNAQGVLVRTLKIAADAPQLLQIDLARWSEGGYLVQLRTEGEGPVVRKLMVLGE